MPRDGTDIGGSGYDPVPLDYYVEPEWAVELLFDAVRFTGNILDPCCGRGTILKIALRRGHPVVGYDIAKRRKVARFPFIKKDFLAEPFAPSVINNIVVNPPFSYERGIAERVIRKAIGTVATGGKIDYCWAIWHRGRPVDSASIGFLRKKPERSKNKR